MCGRYYLVTSIETIARLFGVDLSRAGGPRSQSPRYNIAPQQMIPVVRVRDGQSGSSDESATPGMAPPREVAMLSWGFVPSWTRDLREATKPINARAETATEKPMFRDAFQRRRCIVPADGWYEWQVDPATGNKTPQLMRVLDQAGQPTCFAMAGVWESWQNRDPDPSRRVEHESCAILTTQAAKSCAHVHDRMPVILPNGAIDRWLDPTEKDAKALASLLVPFDAGAGLGAGTISITRVSRRVNSPKNDGPDLIEPAGDEDLLKADPTPRASRSRGARHGEDPTQGSLFGN
jgi:putative SOS response-associated peptidase YedK